MFDRMVDAIWRQTYARYILASGLSLAMDFGTLVVLLWLTVPALAASVCGYLLGLCVHWSISSRAVFVCRARLDVDGRLHQKLLFFGSALVGLAITSTMVGVGTLWGADPRLVKLAAITVSFQVTYLLRRSVVFG
ncbi:GtrA family protein [Sphingobium sp. SJ10-10]|uniref:GtrA family protein n=1 Tax=Sphingobium sp. SJ10-10 TaxID=3114999 RepID=UPI002E16CD28|nr:GtrA family protein [Sphingobium sp. SJ10-10]